MKKLFVAVGLALFAFSCSSDESEKEDPLPPKPLTQYEVDYKISNEELDTYPLLEKHKRRVILLEQKEDTKFGNLGVLYFGGKSDWILHLAYDLCCPIHWEDSDPLKHKLEIDDTGKLVYAVCNIKGFESSFTLEFDNIGSGYAGKNNIKLMKYKVDQYPESGYPNYPEAEGRYISNPNYNK